MLILLIVAAVFNLVFWSWFIGHMVRRDTKRRYKSYVNSKGQYCFAGTAQDWIDDAEKRDLYLAETTIVDKTAPKPPIIHPMFIRVKQDPWYRSEN